MNGSTHSPAGAALLASWLPGRTSRGSSPFRLGGVAVILLAAACGSKPATPQGADLSQAVPLDAAGVVTSTVVVTGPPGGTLKLHAGTTVSILASGQNPAPPPAGAAVRLGLETARQIAPVLPAGVTTLGRFRVVLTVGGQEVEAGFWLAPSSSAAPVAGAIDAGLELVVDVPKSAVTAGTLGLLYQVAAGGVARPAGSSGVYGDPQMFFNPVVTGDLAVGGFTPPASTGGVPAGLYWSRVAVKDPGCVGSGAAQICGPSRVDRVEIIEPSTREILGTCWFQGGDVATTGQVPSGYQFWCQRSQDPASGDTTITISSPQANLPAVRAWLVRTRDGLPMCDVYQPSSGGLNTPAGTVLADPYQDGTLQFAGMKALVFTTTADKDYLFAQRKANQPLVDAGYSVGQMRFRATSPGFVAEIDVHDTLDARVLLEDRIIKKNGWKVRAGAPGTAGNRGTYDYVGRLSVATLFGISLVPQYRIAGETPVGGSVSVALDSTPVNDAVVTANGAPLPLAPGVFGGYDLSGLTIAPGDTVNLSATTADGSQTASISVICPPSFGITSPLDGSLAAGAPLAVTWSPGVPLVPAFTFVPAPVAGQFACVISADGTMSRWGTGAWFVPLTAGQTSVTLTDVVTGCVQSIIEVRTASELAFDAGSGSSAICYLHRRIRQLGP